MQRTWGKGKHVAEKARRVTCNGVADADVGKDQQKRSEREEREVGQRQGPVSSVSEPDDVTSEGIRFFLKDFSLEVGRASNRNCFCWGAEKTPPRNTRQVPESLSGCAPRPTASKRGACWLAWTEPFLRVKPKAV